MAVSRRKADVNTHGRTSVLWLESQHVGEALTAGERVDYKVRRMARLQTLPEQGKEFGCSGVYSFFQSIFPCLQLIFFFMVCLLSFFLTPNLSSRRTFNCDATPMLLAGLLALFQLRACI